MAKRILGVASAGGHWSQLVIIMDAFRDDHDLMFVTTLEGLSQDVTPHPCRIVPDFNVSDMRGAVPCGIALARVFREFKPDLVVSTGAAPGLLAVMVGAARRRRTIWIDSFTNAERLSLSGRLAGWIASEWLTQWPHLARAGGPRYLGSVL